jgi:hypothetical protein
LKIDETAHIWCSDRGSDNHHPTPKEMSRFMKRIVRIERQDKRRDRRASMPEEIDSTVTLIQSLIPLGLHAVGEALEAEVVALAGARYRRTDGRPGVVRWGQ